MKSTPKSIKEILSLAGHIEPHVNQAFDINNNSVIINSMSNAVESIDITEVSNSCKTLKTINFYEDISKVKKLLLLPKFLPTNCSYLKNERKALTTYLYLKFLSTSGCTPINKESAAACFVSLPTFKKRIDLLKKMQLAKVDQDKIYLSSWSQLAKIFLLPKKLTFYFLKYDKNIGHRLIFLAGKESDRAQKRAIKYKKSKTLLHAKASNEALYNDMKNDFRAVKFSTFTNCTINPITTLSRKGIARLVGAKHHTTGTYYAKMFVANGWIVDEPGEIINSYVRARFSPLVKKTSIKWKQSAKKTFYREPNKISYLPHV